MPDLVFREVGLEKVQVQRNTKHLIKEGQRDKFARLCVVAKVKKV